MSEEVKLQQVHAMCEYLRACDMAHMCLKCPALEATPYGSGEPSCYGIALETLEKARDILRPPHPESAVSGERLEELVMATDMRARYEPAEYCKRIDLDTAAALRELQQRRIGEG